MRIVELLPREGCTITAIDNDLNRYFNGESIMLQCTFAGKSYNFICYQEGVQVKNNQVKALYGPAIVCDEGLVGLSEQEAQFIKTCVNENQFDLNQISLK
ncbi:hypothetical protein [Halalkalibacter krulwichiae]|uniref:Uncharacterized protein n=1 Tax=Halalkalibacter krulwichiae TaxID=199441 RepID=A0A1X9MAG6_9BACI|nr:hypothetical protein [Halalkalibacter krulwichiae]ARK30416.1 hypothetical protein BkAM31D_11600 [Halalkalibacter krulwichiae]